jgi:hypothetical protein
MERTTIVADRKTIFILVPSPLTHIKYEGRRQALRKIDIESGFAFSASNLRRNVGPNCLQKTRKGFAGRPGYREPFEDGIDHDSSNRERQPGREIGGERCDGFSDSDRRDAVTQGE